jgi:hypothetical protein
VGKDLSHRTLQAFMAEERYLEKVAAVTLPGSILSGVGRAGRGLFSSIGKGLGGIGKGITELPEAGRETLSLIQHPWKAMKEGWKSPLNTWGGQGKVTKWLPIGQKSLAVGFAAPGLVDAYKASKEAPTPTGEDGPGEKVLGELGGTGGFLAGMASKRFLPGMALMMGGQYLGGRMGRVVDRLRGGADLRTAVGAPSPTEAASQLEDVQRYYG